MERDAKGDEGRQMMLYADQGYALSAVLMTPYPGLLLTPEEAAFNWVMSACRIAVEHEFGRLRNLLRKSQYEGGPPLLFGHSGQSVDVIVVDIR